MRRTTSFAGIQITEESDEENDHEQDREQRLQLEGNAEPVEVTMVDDDSQNRNQVRKSSSTLSLLSMSQASNSTPKGFWNRSLYKSSR